MIWGTSHSENEAQAGALLLDIALLLGLSSLLGGLLSDERYPAFTFMANFGVIMLLLYIGLQIDLQKMHSQGRDIVWLMVLNTAVPFLFGAMFFFWVGLSVDLEGMLHEPPLAISIFLAATLGKPLDALLMVAMEKLSLLEGWTVGMGGYVRLSTEMVVAKLPLDAKLADGHPSTVRVVVSSLSTLPVPLAFTFVVRRRGPRLATPPAAPSMGQGDA